MGVGSGISLVVAPMYLLEMASQEERGRVVNLNQIGIALGTLLAYLFGYLLSSGENWRFMFALGLLPALVQFCGLFSIPESFGKEEKGSWKNLGSPNYRFRFWMVILLSFFQAFSGASAVFFFAPIVFEQSRGLSSSLLASIWIGAAYLLAILVSFLIS